MPSPSVKEKRRKITLQAKWKSGNRYLTREESKGLSRRVILHQVNKFGSRTPVWEGELNYENNFTVTEDNLPAYVGSDRQQYEIEDVGMPLPWIPYDLKYSMNGIPTEHPYSEYIYGQGIKIVGKSLSDGTEVSGDEVWTLTAEHGTGLNLQVREDNHSVDPASGKPLKGVEYTLFSNKDSAVVKKMETDEQGLIQMKGLPQGDYYLIQSRTLSGYTGDDRIFKVGVSGADGNFSVQLKTMDDKMIDSVTLEGCTEKGYLFLLERISVPFTGNVLGVPMWIIVGSIATLTLCGYIVHKSKKKRRGGVKK